MPLVNPIAMLKAARAGGYCVGAINIVDMLSMEAVVAAAEAKKAPVILQTSSGVIKRFGVRRLVGMARLVAGESPVPVALHLDHGTDPKVISEAIKAGYPSVMIDASEHPFAENVAITKRVVDEARATGVAVEGEVGRVVGVEDDIVVNQDEAIYTTPEEALAFQEQTGVDFLAAAIGTAHGFYKVEPKLNIETLRVIHAQASFPLVVHGATGLSFDVIRELVRAGASKMNLSTQVKKTYIDGLYGYISAKRTEYDILKVLAQARSELVAMIGEYIELLGGAGKAN
ncbi:MAG: class II fructose-bisphosphate aldolase [Verrucomicrobia bacterium]|nr:class II fructose-bisphosphate aldolase [Verrucomicrobiota bacterium]